MPVNPLATSRRLRASNRKLYEEAQEACADFGENMNLCIDDIMMSGDIGIIDTW